MVGSDRKVNMHTTHTRGSQSRGGSHLSHEENTKSMQLEIDPMEHVSQFNQKMAVHSRNEALMCKVFSSNLRPVAMRWFYGLRKGSISSFKELTRAFGARFITCSKVPWPLNSLLSMTI